MTVLLAIAEAWWWIGATLALLLAGRLIMSRYIQTA